MNACVVHFKARGRKPHNEAIALAGGPSAATLTDYIMHARDPFWRMRSIVHT